MAGGLASPSWRAERRSSSQVFSTPSSTTRAAPVGDAFAVERLGAQAAPAVRIVDDVDAGRQTSRCAQLVLEEADAARDRRRRRSRRPNGPTGRRRRADRTPPAHSAGFDLARVETLHRALAGAAADRRRIVEIGGMTRAGDNRNRAPCRAFAGQHRNADAVAACLERAGETVRRGQRHARRGPSRPRPLRNW